ncbi:MAG: phage Gp37/Gp68 family protein [Methylocella sp.]
MGEHSKIEWTDASWSPIRAMAATHEGPRFGWHCEHVSEGCRNCYAERMNIRLGTGFEFKPGRLHGNTFGDTRRDVSLFLDEKMLLAPTRWRRSRMIFVCSMTDLFADFVTDEWIDPMFAVMALCPQHTFQVLTKRSARMRSYFAELKASGRWLLWTHPQFGHQIFDPIAAKFEVMFAHIWLGVSAENQETADARIPDLLATPSAVRFVSAEPLLGPIDLFKIRETTGFTFNALSKKAGIGFRSCGLDWVICGGESGPGARPMQEAWAESLRDQCKAAGVAFFMKQMAKKAPIPEYLMIREMPNAR